MYASHIVTSSYLYLNLHVQTVDPFSHFDSSFVVHSIVYIVIRVGVERMPSSKGGKKHKAASKRNGDGA